MGNSNETIQYNCGSKYVGQVLNNLPHGKGILYVNKKSTLFNPKINMDQNDFNVVEGEFENGNLKKMSLSLKNGFKFEGTLPDKNSIQQGKLIDNQNVEYEGTFSKGKLQKGKITSISKDNQNVISYICQTEGQFIGTSIINGIGVFYNINEKYIASGQFYKGKLLNGAYLYQNGDRYQGQLSQGMMNGQGKYYTKNWLIDRNSKSDNKIIKQVKYEKELLQNIKKEENTIQFCYEGSFEASQPSGKGLVKFSNSHSYKGKFKHEKYQGQGEYKFPDGTVYKGSFYGGQMNGSCTIDFTQNSKINLNKQKFEVLQKYQGEVSNGVFHGLGILYYQNGVIFKGYFLNGAKNGPGVLIYCENKFKCLYVMNKLVGELKPIIDQ